MDTKVGFLVVCLTLVSLVKIGDAIQCYECGSLLQVGHEDDACKDTFSSNGISKSSCSGSCAKYKGEKDGIQLVWRTCLDAPVDDDACRGSEQDGVDVDICLCNSDLCNAATTSGISAVTFLALIVIGVWLTVRQ